jgi:hypothetical protein
VRLRALKAAQGFTSWSWSGSWANSVHGIELKRYADDDVGSSTIRELKKRFFQPTKVLVGCLYDASDIGARESPYCDRWDFRRPLSPEHLLLSCPGTSDGRLDL